MTHESGADRPARRAGFTLVEVLMVVAIIGVLSAMALPRVNTRAYRADAGARQVRSTLELAQRLSVARQYDVVVGFSVAANRLRVFEDRNGNGAVDAGERVTWHALPGGTRFATPAAAVPGAPAGGPVALSAGRTIDGMPSIVFRRSGATSTNGAVYLAGSDSTRDQRAIWLEQASGRAEWFRRTDGAWKRSNP